MCNRLETDGLYGFLLSAFQAVRLPLSGRLGTLNVSLFDMSPQDAKLQMPLNKISGNRVSNRLGGDPPGYLYSSESLMREVGMPIVEDAGR